MTDSDFTDIALNKRKTDYPIADMIVSRWSPRALSAERITRAELMPLFEAARWAPSSYNNQPWRFVYAMRETEYWDKFFGLLIPGNQIWAKNAAVLIIIIGKKTFDFNGETSPTHSFDCGAAWQNIALQGSKNGLVVHGMQGFDYDKAATMLGLGDEYQVEIMVAVGKPGRKENLDEKLRLNETPSDRKSIAEIVAEGDFAKFAG